MSGLLVVIEGIEACGKSTQARRLSEGLNLLGFPTLTVREPGGTAVGEKIRSIFIEHFEELVPETEVALLLAAKRQLLTEKIFPALEQGKIVICDRGTATLLAYQCGGKDIPAAFVIDMIQVMDCVMAPHITFYLRIDNETSRERLNQRRRSGDTPNLIDEQAMEFHERVRKKFEQMLIDGESPFLGAATVIDGTKPEQDITYLMIQEILELCIQHETSMVQLRD